MTRPTNRPQGAALHMYFRSGLAAACLLLASACTKNQATEPPQDNPQTPAAEVAKPAAAPQPKPVPTANGAPTATELPMPEDFEEEVASTINEKNYETELSALEKELSSRP